MQHTTAESNAAITRDKQTHTHKHIDKEYKCTIQQPHHNPTYLFDTKQHEYYLQEQLVGFYYLWKKTPEATKPKALPRQRNQTATLKRANKNGQNKASRPASTELLDYASASESEIEAMEAEGKAPQYACHHCYGSSEEIRLIRNQVCHFRVSRLASR
jgi:hypothetical protein